MNTIRSLAVHRGDGELIGYVSQTPSAEWSPCTVFGVPIGQPTSRDEAEAYLHSHGLGYLAERWVYSNNEQQVTVQIVEASPASVTLRFVDYGYPAVFGTTRTLRTPIGDVLRLA